MPAGDEDAESVLQKLTDPTFDFNFKLPILDDPAQGIFDLLLGRDADLVSLSAAMHVHADSSNANGLSFAGVGLMFVGSIQVDATLTFNYDTFGLRELINDLGSGQSAMTIASEIPGDIADGFYVDTAHTSLSVSGGIFAQIGASYGIVSIGVSGGVSTGDVSTGDGEKSPISITLSPPVKPPGDDGNPPPNNDKIRFKDIDLDQPLEYFKLSGELDASLVLSVQIGVTVPILGFVGFSHDFGLASTVLLDFNHPSPPKQNALATLDGHNLVLAVGLIANFAQGMTT